MRMLHRLAVLLTSVCCLGLAGCADPIPAGNSQSPPAEIAVPAANSKQSSAAEQTASSSPPPVNVQPSAAAATGPITSSATAPITPQATINPPPSTTAAELRVRLRGGVALPQSLPTGTAMGFSLEYEIQVGSIDGSATYEWVIESPQSGTWKRRVNLQNRGSLETFVTDWPPDPGTYTTYLQQTSSGGHTRVISEKVRLTYSCG